MIQLIVGKKETGKKETEGKTAGKGKQEQK